MEDVYLTGMCASVAVFLADDWTFDPETSSPIKPMDMAGFKFRRFDPQRLLCYYGYNSTVTGHNLSVDEMHLVWRYVTSANSSCTKNRTKLLVRNLSKY